MGHAIFTRCALRIARGEKAGIRNEEEKTLVPGSADAGSEKALSKERAREREREKAWGFLGGDLSRFYFYCTRPREGDDLSIFRRALTVGLDVTQALCALRTSSFQFLRSATRREV